VPKNPALRNALRHFQRLGWLKPNDRSFVDRWLQVADDPIWDQVAAAIAATGRVAGSSGSSHNVLVRKTILNRRLAEDFMKLDLKHELKKTREKKRRLKELADKMEDLIQTYRDCDGASEALGPTAFALRKNVFAWLEKDARRLHELAVEPKGPHIIGGMRVSRQKRGRKRPDARAISVFVQHSSSFIEQACDKSLWRVIAELTDLAFPSPEPFNADEVRSMCRPTTRSGRRKKPAHSNAKSAKKGR
jgi:hypothetical protein